ncbi:MAG: prepilin-type N-terminal cleavage/methylation domain-containing protein [Eubacterium sp.]|nr:prepilin-type N-terminal cleavage/methylation domain-containing protein [Eubacterium sp.]
MNRLRSKLKTFQEHGRGLQQGFTLIEVVVTMVVLSVVLAISAGGLMGWQEWSNFKTQNENARQLFASAQNQLTEYSSSGQLAVRSKEIIKNTDELDVTKVTDGEGSAYTLRGVWYESAVDPGDYKSYVGHVQTIQCKRGDWKTYRSNPEDSSLSYGAKLLFEIISPYVAETDTELLNAAICIEFTPEDGQIFSLCYSNRNDAFVYDGYESTLSGTINISDRSEDYRQARMIGYYGVDELAKSTSYTAQPEISQVKLNNQETLNLSFKVNTEIDALADMTFDVGVYDYYQGGAQRLKIYLKASNLYTRANRKPVNCQVVVYDTEGNQVSEGEFPILAWYEGKTVCMVLDAASIQATGALYEDYAAGSTVSNFEKTYSAHRFFANLGLEEPEVVYCTVQGKSSYYTDTAVKTSQNQENLFFATEEEGDRGSSNLLTKARIENGRHLFNIRYREIQEAKASVKNGLTYLLTQDLDWDEFEASGNFYDSEEKIDLEGEDFSLATVHTLTKGSENCVSYVTDAYFETIETLEENHTFSAGGYTISGLKLSGAANTLFGLYSSNDSDAKFRLGLFGSNYGSIQDLTLSDVSVKGGARLTDDQAEQAGAICGFNSDSGIISDCQIVTVADSAKTISGKSCVGAVAGRNNGSIENATVKKMTLTDVADSGKTFVGGLVGYNAEGASITFPAGDNLVKNVDLSSRNDGSQIGGVAGYNGGSIQGSLSGDSPASGLTLTIEFAGSATAAAMGGVAGVNQGLIANLKVDGEVGQVDGLGQDNLGYGGIAGRSGLTSQLSQADLQEDAYPCQITRCNFDGKVICSGTSAKPAYAGGIVGLNQYGSLVDHSYVGTDKSQKTQIRSGATGGTLTTAYAYVGGLLGANYGKLTEANNKKNSEADLLIEAYNGAAGGLVGENFQPGKITGSENERLSTGAGWTLETYGTACSTGGMIGVLDSGIYMKAMSNFVNVTGKNKAAGFVGKIEASNRKAVFYNCINHGLVDIDTSDGRSAGFVAQAADGYGDIFFEDCVNTGVMTRRESADSQGANCVGFCVEEATYDNCRNYGTMKSYGFGGVKTLYDSLSHGWNFDVNYTSYRPFSSEEGGSYSNAYYIYKSGFNRLIEWIINIGLRLFGIADQPDGISVMLLSDDVLYSSTDQSDTITMTENSPIASAYYGDDYTTYTESKQVTNGRIPVYEEMDPLFEEMIGKKYDKATELAAPKDLAVSHKTGAKTYEFSWTGREKARMYQVYYTLTDASGEVKYTSDRQYVSRAREAYFVEEEEVDSHWDSDWGSNYQLHFYVRSISQYHVDESSDQYDSDWAHVDA